MLIKTEPNRQWAVAVSCGAGSRQCFEQNQVQTAGPGRVYVVDQGTGKTS
jgi:hypothetical protein